MPISSNNQPISSLYSANAGIVHLGSGVFLSSAVPSTNTLTGPNGPFVKGNLILVSGTGLYYLDSISTSGGVTSATWIQLQGGSSGGVLPVVDGGTGVSTLTGLALGSGTSPFTGVTYTPVTAWTPNLQINGSSTGITYSPAPTGFYQQIGSMVYFNASINLSSKGASTGAVTISNLPVATGTNGGNNVIYVITSNVTSSTNYTDVYGAFGTSSAVLNFEQIGSGVTSESLSNTNVANNSSFLLTGLYFVN